MNSFAAANLNTLKHRKIQREAGNLPTRNEATTGFNVLVK